MNKTKLISNSDVEKCLTPELLIPLMSDVLKGLHTGEIKSLPRQAAFLDTKNIFALMAADVPSLGICGCKNAIFPGPGCTTQQSFVSLFDSRTGELRALVSAECITVARTAATTAAATDALARKDAEVLCLMGAGNQGLAHARAIMKVRAVKEVRFWNIHEEAAKRACEKISAEFPGLLTAYSTDAENMVRGADIICTVSKASEPILFGKWLKKGCHVNAIGACSPFVCELDVTVLKEANVFVDTFDCAKASAGDILIPVKAGEYSFDEIKGEAGAVIAGEIRAREKGDEITLFESCGISAQDVVAANEAWKRAEGVTFEF